MKTAYKILAAAGIGIAALASSSAMARDHVSFGISIGAPAPVYVAPPAPVYVPPPAYYAPPPAVVYRPAPVYVAPPAYGYYGYRGGYYGPRHHHHHGWR
jgi:hypothetical protein